MQSKVGKTAPHLRHARQLIVPFVSSENDRNSGNTDIWHRKNS